MKSGKLTPPLKRLKLERDKARRALRSLLLLLDCCGMEAGMVWEESDRREFLKMAGLR